NSASFTITGPGSFTRTGTIDVSHSATISATIPAIPAGTGYSVGLSATSTDGKVGCAGSTMFNVVGGATTPATVHLACHETPRTANVLVNRTLNLCPLVDGISASPAEIIVGGSISLAAFAHDSDAAPAPLSYSWTATSGEIDAPTSQNARFFCTVTGNVTITL